MHPADEFRPEIDELYRQVAPLFKDRNGFVAMVVLAQMFASWMMLHDEEELDRAQEVFHLTAMDAYDDMLDREKLH